MPTPAPSDEVLRSYLAGSATAQEVAGVEAWIEVDPGAVGVLDRLRQSGVDRFVAAVREAGAVSHVANPPPQVGHYRLISQLGEGGMGTVWMAEQRTPVRRDVAIKLIRPGMDSHQVLARFETERQTLALLDHPNIARVLDGGMPDKGLPYFVMELIKGAPLTEYCDARRLSIHERVILFTSVCRAVHHAHQKGIIHRDLKPSNILVERKDGVAVPKVIDFGLAKAMHFKLTDLTLHTQVGTLLGTVEYMSPEQAGPTPWDVDTRSDIYSLGAILYELLTGRPPLSKEDLKARPMDEVLRVVREVDPPQPSSRLGGSNSSLLPVEQRGQDLRQLKRIVSGDLDRVTMKALEKDPNRRYETALELSNDLDRYLRDEPVVANPPSRVYRARRFIRRNVGAVLAGTLAVLGLTIGTALAIVGMLHAREAERSAVADRNRAELAEADARKEAASAKLAEARARLLAAEAEKQANLADAREHEASRERGKAEQISDALTSLFVAADPVGLNDYTSLIRRPVGQRLSPVDLLRQMAESLRTDRAMDKSVKFSLLVRIAVAAMNQTEPELAEGAIRQAEEIARAHFPEDSREMAEAVHYSAAIEELNGRYGVAEARYREALRLREAIVKRTSDVVASRRVKNDLALTQLTLSLLYSQLEDFKRAEELARKGLALRLELFGPDSRETAIARLYLAICLIGDIAMTKKAEAALLSYQAKQFFEKNEGTRTLVRAVFKFMDGVQGHWLGVRDNCIADLNESLSLAEKIVGNRHPYYLFVHGQLGCVLSDHGRYEEAHAILMECLKDAADLRFLTHPKMLYPYMQLIITTEKLNKQGELEPVLTEWLRAHERADKGSQFYADALLLTARTDLGGGESARGQDRINQALEVLKTAPSYGGRATTRQLLQVLTEGSMARRDHALAKKLSDTWAAMEEEFGTTGMQAEARYQQIMARLALGEDGLELSRLIERFEREGESKHSEDSRIKVLGMVFRSREALNRGDIAVAEQFLGQAEGRARDANGWYACAIQAARLHSSAGTDARFERVISALEKAVSAGYSNRASIEGEALFRDLRGRAEFKSVVGRLVEKNGGGPARNAGP